MTRPRGRAKQPTTNAAREARYRRRLAVGAWERLEPDADPAELGELENLRPRSRAACARGLRPCPWVGCRWHLALVSLDPLLILDPSTMLHTCALDVADKGGQTLEEVAQIYGLSRERIRQIEERMLERLRPRAPGLAVYLDSDPLSASTPWPLSTHLRA